MSEEQAAADLATIRGMWELAAVYEFMSTFKFWLNFTQLYALHDLEEAIVKSPGPGGPSSWLQQLCACPFVAYLFHQHGLSMPEQVPHKQPCMAANFQVECVQPGCSGGCHPVAWGRVEAGGVTSGHVHPWMVLSTIGATGWSHATACVALPFLQVSLPSCMLTCCAALLPAAKSTGPAHCQHGC